MGYSAALHTTAQAQSSQEQLSPAPCCSCQKYTRKLSKQLLFGGKVRGKQ